MPNSYLDTFQKDCLRTRREKPQRDAFLNGAMGLAGEAIETLEVVMDHTPLGDDMVARDLLIKEIGDIMWYAADLASSLGFNLSAIVKQNIGHSVSPWTGEVEFAERFAWKCVLNSGRILEAMKKHIFHDKALDLSKTFKAIDAIVFYAAALAATLEASLEYVCEQNVDKLRERYPDGFAVQPVVQLNTPVTSGCSLPDLSKKTP